MGLVFNFYESREYVVLVFRLLIVKIRVFAVSFVGFRGFVGFILEMLFFFISSVFKF